MAPKLISIMGKKRAGKDTLTKMLQEFHPYKQVAFADGVWDVLLAADPYVDLRVGWRLSQVVRFHTRDEAKMLYPEIRRLLQDLGTDGIRNHIGKDTWVQVAEAKLDADPDASFILSDLRFPNEADMVRRRGGLLVKIERAHEDESYGANHVSESYFDQLPYDVLVTNNSDLNDLRKVAEELIRR